MSKVRLSYFDLLSGSPICVDEVGHLRPPVLKEICPTSGIGYNLYNLYLNFLSWDKDKLLQYDKLLELRGSDKLEAAADKLTAYDIVTLLPQTRDLCREVLAFFMLEDIVWDDAKRKFVATFTDDEGQHLAGEIGRNNFEAVRSLILQMNYIGIDNDDEASTRYSNGHAKELWEKAQKYLKAQAANRDQKDKTEYHIGNIISKLCAAHPSYNLLNVWDLTIFQLYDAFFQFGYLRCSDLNEMIFSNHGGDKFKFEDWLKPIIKQS